jgi:predicted phosphodiesterase
MRIGILSDIHGNYFAFEEIYKRLKQESCDAHLFLGDICGYYFQQNEILDILRTLPHLEAICGNHDVMFLKSLENEHILKHYTERFGLSFERLRETISEENLNFLKNLPREYRMEHRGIAGYHGSPWSPVEEYVYVDSPMERFDRLEEKVIFLGHTHHPMDVVRKNIRIVNPGSAGQPRDGGWPSYAVYDVDTEQLEIHRVKYNVSHLIGNIKLNGDSNPYLMDVLMRIRG